MRGTQTYEPAGVGNAWTYALATPDAVIGGALNLIFGRLAAFGLTPIACQLIGLEVRKMQEFYGVTKFHIQNPGSEDFEIPWHAHDVLYGIAPGCLIVLSCPSGDACTQMLKCKGRTRPEISDPGSIRYSGENVIFNLIHSPDDAESILRELPILVGTEQARRLLGVATSGLSMVSGLCGVDALPPCLPYFCGPEGTSFAWIGNRIRCRITQLLSLALHDDERALCLLGDIQQLLAAERRSFRNLGSSTERLRAAQRANHPIADCIATAADLLGDEVIASGAEALAELYSLQGSRRLDSVFSLSHRGIFFSPLERVILESHSYAFRPNREIDAIYA